MYQTTIDLGKLSTKEAPGNISQSGYRPDIDGLRAVAISSVVLFHSGIGLFSGGFVGVDIFFVISGFLIGRLIYKEILAGEFTFSRFYQRRAKRILPALLTVLALCYLSVPLLLSPRELTDFSKNAIATVVSFSNIQSWLSSGYFAPSSELNPLLMTWSLSVEEQFYIFFPIIMILLARIGPRRMMQGLLALSVLSFALSCLALQAYPSPVFYLLPFRAWELGVGAMLVFFPSEDREGLLASGPICNLMSFLGLALIGYSVFFYTRVTPFPGPSAGVPVAGAILTIVGRQSWFNRNLLAAHPVVSIGLLSYSWYLLHWPILSFARICCDRPLDSGISLALIAVSLGLAALSYRFIEQPFRRSATPAGQLLRRYGMLSAVLIIPGSLLLFGRGLPERFPHLAQLENSATRLKSDPCVANEGDSTPKVTPGCAPEDQVTTGVALLGDSHATALAQGLREIGERENFHLEEFTKTSCPALLGVSRLIPELPEHEEQCESYNRGVMDLIRRHRSIKVVVLAGFWSAPFAFEKDKGERFVRIDRGKSAISASESRDNFRFGLNDEIRAARSLGKDVIILKDNPRFSFDPLAHVRINLIPARCFLADTLFSRERIGGTMSAPPDGREEDNEASAIIDQVAAQNDARVFDLKATLSAGDGNFLYRSPNSIYFVDPQHLSLSGARVALTGLKLLPGSSSKD